MANAASIAVLALLLADPQALVGQVQALGPAQNRRVALHVRNRDIMLTGALVEEVGHLGGAQVELLGDLQGDGRLAVRAYRIVEIAGRQRPTVGTLVRVGPDGLGVQDGAGLPIVLNASPELRRRLGAQVGAKVWVHGKKLLSGELKVQGYGLLRAAAASDDASGR